MWLLCDEPLLTSGVCLWYYSFFRLHASSPTLFCSQLLQASRICWIPSSLKLGKTETSHQAATWKAGTLDACFNYFPPPGWSWELRVLSCSFHWGKGCGKQVCVRQFKSSPSFSATLNLVPLSVLRFSQYINKSLRQPSKTSEHWMYVSAFDFPLYGEARMWGFFCQWCHRENCKWVPRIFLQLWHAWFCAHPPPPGVRDS